ncbi:MAG: Ig-like domain-containing protein [Clostridia bacterium]|nr:Ig-like domain-containing protein [Clostridia bacterium]
MKKIIIAILLLIPILVILTIDASGKLIASALVDIPAESVVIKRGGKALASDEIDLEDYLGTGKIYSLFSEVFPGIATDEMKWVSSDPSVAEVKTSETRKNAADILFKDYGSVDITCTSEKNESISARMTLYVGGKIPGRISVRDYQGAEYEEISLPKFGVMPLFAEVKPSSSVRSEKIVWTSSDESVAKVDDNGVLKGVAAGNCVLTASVTANKTTVRKEVAVSVSGSALLKESVVYAASDSFDVSPYLAYSGSEVEGGSVVGLSGVASFGEKKVKVSYQGREEILTVVKVDSAKTLLIENLAFLKAGALSSFLALGTSNVRLKAFALDGSSPEISFVSSDESVVRFDQTGRMFAVGSGEAEIGAAAEGYAAEKIVIRVTSPVEDFRLSETVFADSVGLMQERVFGNTTYSNGVYSKTFPLSVVSTFPAGVGIEAFSFESTNPEIARVDERGVITFADDVEGKEVTITATAYNQEGRAVRNSYTFRLVNGVNVGVGYERAHFDREANETPDFAPYFDFKTVCYGGRAKAVVLHTDIYYPSKEAGGETILNANLSFYGNGKKLDGQYLVNSVEDEDVLLLWDFSKISNMPEKLSVSIFNLNFQATQPTTDDSQSAFEELSKKGGGAFTVKGAYPEGDHDATFIIKGCLFQYAYSHVNLANGSVTIDGCIFRNNPACGVVLQQSTNAVANLKLKNCIFSNTIAPVGIACGNFDDILDRFSGKEGSDAPIRFGKLEIEGQLYIYNWKKLEEVQMNLLPQNLDDPRANSLVKSFNGVLAKVIQQSFMKSSQENLYEDKDGEKWLNFSFLVIGIWADMMPSFNGAPETEGLQISFDPKKYLALEVMAYKAPAISSGLMTIAKSIGVDLERNKTYHINCKDEAGKWNTVPGETYTIGKSTYDRLNGRS